MDLIIRNARCATEKDSFTCDIGIRQGTIVALERALAGAADEIDAAGRWVLPGGIDSHVHFDQRKTHGGQNADTFRSGTISAACGGNTTVIPFAAQHRGQSVRWAVGEYHARAGGNAVIDYAFHLIISDPGLPDVPAEIAAAAAAGVRSLKVFTTYDAIMLDDAQIMAVFELARAHRCLVMVHCENTQLIARATRMLLESGHTDAKYHAASRPAIAEAEAVMRVCALAEFYNVPTLIVHVSSDRTLPVIAWSRDAGVTLHAETCIQYLTLSHAPILRGGAEAAKFICSPPLRSGRTADLLWQAVCGGTFDLVSSDHSPYRFDDTGKFAHGRDSAFNRIASGLPGVETRLPLLFTHGVRPGRLTINQFVALTATNAAKIYGLHPRKGTIAIGSDADLCIWDDTYRGTVSNSLLHHGVDYTPYEGMDVAAWPAVTLSRGRVVARYHDFVGPEGHGRFVPSSPRVPGRDETRTQAELRELGLDLRPAEAAPGGAGGGCP